MIKLKDKVRLRPRTYTSELNPGLADASGAVAVVRFIDGPIVAATVQFETARLKGVPVGDLIVAK